MAINTATSILYLNIAFRTKCSYVNIYPCLYIGMPEITKSTRRLKIVKRFSSRTVAALTLSGKWLEQAGFKIGTYVEVTVQEQRLVIAPSRPVKK